MSQLCPIYVYDFQKNLLRGYSDRGVSYISWKANTPITGKLEKNKDVPAIMAAHGINYVATCSASYPLDIFIKLKKAMTIQGVKYLHIHTPCPPGWGFDPRYTVKIGKLAVETGLYTLYEIEYSDWSFTGPSKRINRKKLRPVIEYFKMQTRFKALTESRISEIQQQIYERIEDQSGN